MLSLSRETAPPFIDDLYELSCVTVIKVIGAIDEPATSLGADSRGDLLGVLVEKFGFGTPNQSEQGAAETPGIRPAIIIIVAAVFVDVRTRREDARCGADADKQQFVAFAFSDQPFGFVHQLAKTRLARDPL